MQRLTILCVQGARGVSMETTSSTEINPKWRGKELCSLNMVTCLRKLQTLSSPVWLWLDLLQQPLSCSFCSHHIPRWSSMWRCVALQESLRAAALCSTTPVRHMSTVPARVGAFRSSVRGHCALPAQPLSQQPPAPPAQAFVSMGRNPRWNSKQGGKLLTQLKNGIISPLDLFLSLFMVQPYKHVPGQD